MNQKLHHSPLKNPATLWAETFVSALAAAGLRRVCIAPGSRSTPLTLAFAAHEAIEVHRGRDERSAGFFALGMALALDEPAALVSTSGTAVANFLPAIIEAKMSHVPLLVLTGDRPHELRHSGANQTIDQVKIFGDQVLWSVDMPLPEQEPPDVALRNVAATAVRAHAMADGVPKGPVHVNFPFRKPLEPTPEHTPFTIHNSQFTIHNFERGRVAPTEGQLTRLAILTAENRRGLIVCGPRCPGGDFPAAVAALARRAGWPILADPLSGVRYGPWVKDTAVISGYETFLQADPGWPPPQVVLRFGAAPTGKWLNVYLDRIRPAHRIHVRGNGVWADDSHRTTLFLAAEETAVCHELLSHLPRRDNREWETAVIQTDAACWQRLEPALAERDFDGALIPELLKALPSAANLFVGNSLPVRHLDQYGRSRPKLLHVYGNRGASGIDGNISAGLGVAAAGRPTAILVGDLTAYHDLTGLLFLKDEGRRTKEEAGRRAKEEEGRGKKDEGRRTKDEEDITQHAARNTLHATVIVLNNDGGGIFRRLPIARHDPPFTELFLTPHGLSFAGAADMFKLAYRRLEGGKGFREVLEAAIATPAPHLIEVITDGARDEEMRREVEENVNG